MLRRCAFRLIGAASHWDDDNALGESEGVLAFYGLEKRIKERMDNTLFEDALDEDVGVLSYDVMSIIRAIVGSEAIERVRTYRYSG